jgi:hypothetical protein
MSPPTPEQEDSALAALAGTITERKPTTQLERDMFRVRLIAQLKEQGVPWAVIGNALSTDGKQAKRDFHVLAQRTQRTMLAEKARQDGIAPPVRGRARTPRKGATPKPRVMAVGWPDETAGFADGKTGKGVTLAP